MGRLRVLSGREVCKILAEHGFVPVRHCGSHIIARLMPGVAMTPEVKPWQQRFLHDQPFCLSWLGMSTHARSPLCHDSDRDLATTAGLQDVNHRPQAPGLHGRMAVTVAALEAFGVGSDGMHVLLEDHLLGWWGLSLKAAGGSRTSTVPV